ncbi:MAG: urease accessory protein UreF [Alphaproteobacteria bacterium]
MLDPLLTLLQVANAAFPTGAFNHSYGFETLIERGEIKDAASLEAHCRDWLRHAVAPADGAAAALAHRAQRDGDLETLTAIDDAVGALKLAREAREASAKTGRALHVALREVFDGADLSLLDAMTRSGRSEGHQAVIFGAGAAALGISRADAVLAFLQTALGNMASVGARLIPLGQVETQRIVTHAQRTIRDAADVAMSRPLGMLGAAAIVYDIAAMEHERLPTRLCMS